MLTSHRVTAAGETESARPLGWLLTIAGAIGWLASFQLTVDHWRVLQDPSFVPACSINSVVSCGSVMESAQGSLFGFPNMLLGLGGFAAVAALGTALLAGARFHRLLWLALEGGTLIGVLFTHWLVYESLYSLGTLCPYCMVVWVVTIALFWYTTLHVLTSGKLGVPARLRPVVRTAAELPLLILLVWYAVIGLLTVTRFWV